MQELIRELSACVIFHLAVPNRGPIAWSHDRGVVIHILEGISHMIMTVPLTLAHHNS